MMGGWREFSSLYWCNDDDESNIDICDEMGNEYVGEVDGRGLKNNIGKVLKVGYLDIFDFFVVV